MIRVHIERLVLDGVPLAAGDSPKLRAAVERELARLVAERGIGGETRSGGALESVRGGAVRSERVNAPAKLGRQVAEAVYKGIGQ